MTIHQLYSILLARWKVAAISFAAVVVLGVGITLLLPKQYTAVASVVVDAKPDPISAMMYQGGATSAFMATQVDVIHSERVAQRVVRNLKLPENPTIRKQWQDATHGEGDIVNWLGETFQRNMDVKPSRESNVIEITYKAIDPNFAAGLANAFVQAYIETTLELKVDPARQYSSFFETRAKDARDVLEKAQARLSAFQMEKGIIASDERLDVENARLNELSTQLVSIQSLSADSGSRQIQANSGSGDRIQEVLNNPLISGLKSDLSRAEVKLQELSSRLGENHPQVQEAKANIAELKVKVDTETRRVMSGVGVTNTINRQREAEIRGALEAQRAKVLRMKATRDEGSVLLRDVENAQKAYDVIQARLNQSSLESQTTLSNVNVLTSAVAPLHPSSPKLLINLLVSVFVGIVLALALTLGMELFDRRVRVPQDLVQTVGLPIIGVMPRPVAAGTRGGLKALLLKQRIVGAQLTHEKDA